MKQPSIEMADIIRSAGKSFIEKNRSWFSWQHLRVLRAIARCRTAALGGHLDRCSRCQHQAISYNSCRNRHCAKCQTRARDQWLAAREKELLPVPYVHVVFTIPHELSMLALANKKVIYDLLFRASAATLLEIAADKKHLGADIGFLSVLHTWGQNVLHHPHVHCVIPAGGLSLDHDNWVRPRYAFFLPVEVLSRVFRGKFVAGLKRAFRKGKLIFPSTLNALAQAPAFRSFLRSLYRNDWVVYAKPPFGGPHHVLHYLARYTHRVAISNHRLVAFADGKVTLGGLLDTSRSGLGDNDGNSNPRHARDTSKWRGVIFNITKSRLITADLQIGSRFIDIWIRPASESDVLDDLATSNTNTLAIHEGRNMLLRRSTGRASYCSICSGLIRFPWISISTAGTLTQFSPSRSQLKP